MTVYAVDPGLTTGWAVLNTDYATPAFDCGEDTVDEVIQWVKGELQPSDTVVCERFLISKATLTRLSHAQYPLRGFYVLEFLAKERGARFVGQTPAEAKSFGGAPRYDKLRALDWYRPTKGNHSADASAHLLLYLAKEAQSNAIIRNVLQPLFGQDGSG